MTITSSVYELWRREPNQRRGTSSPVSSGHGRVPLPVGPSVVTVPAVDQYWTPCSSSPWICQLSSTCCDQVLGYILAEEKKGSLGWLVQLVCALKPMIVKCYDIILLTELCFQSYGGIPKPMNCWGIFLSFYWYTRKYFFFFKRQEQVSVRSFSYCCGQISPSRKI